MYDVIIVGAGPAGLTGALYLLRAGKKVLILEAKAYGGQIINANEVENYPGISSISGFEFATNLFNQVKRLGAEIKYETVIRIEKDKTCVTDKAEYKGDAVIIATGAAKRKLNLSREEELTGKGVSYCATCDGNFYKNKVVAVNGGGNTALEDALYLSNVASKVYLIHRRDEFRGELQYLNELKTKNNVEFILNSTIAELKGDERLESVIIKDKNMKTREIAVDGLFIAIGQKPENEAFSSVSDLSSDGYIESVDDVRTKTDGIYVAGDTRVKDLRQLTTAVSDGSIAANYIIKEMKGAN